MINTGLFFFSWSFVKIVVLPMGINLRGGIVGNLLYGGCIVSTWALNELTAKRQKIKENIVFMIQRKDIIC